MRAVKIIQCAHELGFEVFLNSKLREITGAVLVTPEMIEKFGTDKAILITSNTLAIERLNIAMGIVHYQLHFNPDKNMEFCKCYNTRLLDFRRTTDTMDRTTEILLPLNSFDKSCKFYSKLAVTQYELITALMDDYQVTRDCVEYRLNTLRKLHQRNAVQ